jgi:hypothetical protein
LLLWSKVELIFEGVVGGCLVHTQLFCLPARQPETVKTMHLQAEA